MNIGYPELDLKETNEDALFKYASSYKPVDSDLSEAIISQAMTHARRKAEEEGRVFDEVRFLEILTGVKPSSGITFLADINNLIITTGFGQFVLKGKVSKDLIELTRIAIQRELSQMLLNLYDKDVQDVRKEQLHNMIEKLDKMNLKG